MPYAEVRLSNLQGLTLKWNLLEISNDIHRYGESLRSHAAGRAVRAAQTSLEDPRWSIADHLCNYYCSIPAFEFLADLLNNARNADRPIKKIEAEVIQYNARAWLWAPGEELQEDKCEARSGEL